jgi:uncharacterized transporter YbjL
MTNTGKKYILFTVSNVILLLICISTVSAQNNKNYLQVTGASTGFNLTSTATLEAQQTNSNAFQVVVASKGSNTFSMYAKVSSSTTSTSTPMPASMLAVKLNSMSPTLTANFNAISLSTNDQLIQQITTSNQFWNNNNTITFNYDLLAGPVGYNYAPGSYTFTLLFTMTQP